MDILKNAMNKRGMLAAMARELGVTPQTMLEWRDGDRPIPVRHCHRICARLSIDRRDLRPDDWGDIWPELINAEHPWPPVAAETTQEAA
jgi:DNA-binding transcriptional regulator YdaS (Cro superfamily)